MVREVGAGWELVGVLGVGQCSLRKGWWGKIFSGGFGS